MLYDITQITYCVPSNNNHGPVPGTVLGVSHTRFVINKAVRHMSLVSPPLQIKGMETRRSKATQLLNGRAGI